MKTLRASAVVLTCLAGCGGTAAPATPAVVETGTVEAEDRQEHAVRLVNEGTGADWKRAPDELKTGAALLYSWDKNSSLGEPGDSVHTTLAPKYRDATEAYFKTLDHADSEKVIEVLALVHTIEAPAWIANYRIASGTARVHSVKVSRRAFGERWPFTVPEGTLACIEGELVVFQVGEEVYGLNGLALNAGFPKFEPIWRKNPAIPGTRIDISPMIEFGLEQCEKQ